MRPSDRLKENLAEKLKPPVWSSKPANKSPYTDAELGRIYLACRKLPAQNWRNAVAEGTWTGEDLITYQRWRRVAPRAYRPAVNPGSLAGFAGLADLQREIHTRVLIDIELETNAAFHFETLRFGFERVIAGGHGGKQIVAGAGVRQRPGACSSTGT